MIELSTLMHKVPYVTECKTVPCVWDITSFLTPFMRTTHDFGNVHHVWIHKSVEGTVSVNDNIFMQLLLNWLTLWKISKRQNTVICFWHCHERTVFLLWSQLCSLSKYCSTKVMHAFWLVNWSDVTLHKKVPPFH